MYFETVTNKTLLFLLRALFGPLLDYVRARAFSDDVDVALGSVTVILQNDTFCRMTFNQMENFHSAECK